MTKSYTFPGNDVADADNDVSNHVTVGTSCSKRGLRVSVCGGSIHFTPPWMWMYCLVALALHAYLIHRAVGVCQDFNSLAWASEDNGPVWALYFYIVCLVLSVVCAPVYTIASLLRLGNLANDGVKLGRCVGVDDIVDVHMEREDKLMPRSCLGRLWHAVRIRTGPTASLIMVIATGLLLLPPAVITAQKIKHGFEVFNLHSNLDVFFASSRHKSANATGTAGSNAVRDLDLGLNSIGPSAEFVCHVIALLVYSGQYAQVFVHTSLHYACLFVFQLLAAAAFHVFSFCGVSILVTMATNDHRFPGLDLLLSPTTSLCLYVISASTVFLSSLCVFSLGYSQYSMACSQAIRRITSVSGAGQTVGSSAPAVNHRSVCMGYKVHLTAVLPFIILFITRVPALYDYVTIWRHLSVKVALACTVVELSYLVLWLCLWLRLALCLKWTFRVRLCADNVLAKLQAEWNSDAISSASNSHLVAHSTGVAKSVFTISVTREISKEQQNQQQRHESLQRVSTTANSTPHYNNGNNSLRSQLRSNSIGARSNHSNHEGTRRASHHERHDESSSDEEYQERMQMVPTRSQLTSGAERGTSPYARRSSDIAWRNAGSAADVHNSGNGNLANGHFSPSLALSDHQLNRASTLHTPTNSQRVMSPPQRQNSFQHQRRRFQAIAEESGDASSGNRSGDRPLPPYTMRHARSDNVYKSPGLVNILLPWELQSEKSKMRQGGEGSETSGSRVTSPNVRRPASVSSALTPEREQPFEIERYKLKMGVTLGRTASYQQRRQHDQDGGAGTPQMHQREGGSTSFSPFAGVQFSPVPGAVPVPGMQFTSAPGTTFATTPGETAPFTPVSSAPAPFMSGTSAPGAPDPSQRTSAVDRLPALSSVKSPRQTTRTNSRNGKDSALPSSIETSSNEFDTRVVSSEV